MNHGSPAHHPSYAADTIQPEPDATADLGMVCVREVGIDYANQPSPLAARFSIGRVALEQIEARETTPMRLSGRYACINGIAIANK